MVREALHLASRPLSWRLKAPLSQSGDIPPGFTPSQLGHISSFVVPDVQQQVSTVASGKHPRFPNRGRLCSAFILFWSFVLCVRSRFTVNTIALISSYFKLQISKMRIKESFNAPKSFNNANQFLGFGLYLVIMWHPSCKYWVRV